MRPSDGDGGCAGGCGCGCAVGDFGFGQQFAGCVVVVVGGHGVAVAADGALNAIDGLDGNRAGIADRRGVTIVETVVEPKNLLGWQLQVFWVYVDIKVIGVTKQY